MFKVKVVGAYIARSGVMDKEKIRKNYEIEGNIPRLDAALSVVKNKLLAPALAAKYPDYVTFLTYHIVEITPLDEKAKAEMGKTQVIYMDRTALLRFVNEHALEVDPRYYPDLFKFREAVQLAFEDPKGYKKFFEIHEPELRLDIEMAACNPGLFKAVDDKGLIASVSHKAVIPPLQSDKPFGKKVKAKSTAEHEVEQEKRLAGFAAEQRRDGDLGDEDAPDTGDL